MLTHLLDYPQRGILDLYVRLIENYSVEWHPFTRNESSPINMDGYVSMADSFYYYFN